MSAEIRVVKVKAIVPGMCKGELIAVNKYVSFFGEVDPESGCLMEDHLCIPGSVFAFKGTRGSTVAPYVLYALKRKGKNPSCIIVEDVEPMLVTGCVIAEIPLYQVLDFDKLVHFNGWNVEVVNNELRVWKT
ncbi:MAG: DUF126 domain-containing protein [Desulfurococcaceae archaeon]